MSTTAQKPATTPMPVQLSAPEFEVFILLHLSMPKRGLKCTLGYCRVLNLILWDLYTGASKSLRRFFPIFGAWSCLELLSSHGNHGYVAVERQSRFVPSLPKRPLCLLIVI